MNQPSQPWRVGIIGVGWGALVQAPAFRAVPDFELAALCSRRPERAADAAERLGIEDTSNDWREFVTRDDLDVISVCTPTDLHHKQTIAALQAGKHVLCEKPVALDAPHAREMLEVAESMGKAHAVCFENRWGPERLPVWDLIDDGYLGDPYFSRVTIAADYWHPSRSLQSEWMYRLDRGGGYLLGLGAHDIDYLCAVFGEPEAVCADVRTTVDQRQRADGSMLDVDADDTANLMLRMRSGVHALLSLTTVALHARSTYQFEAYGSEGTLAIDGTLFGGKVRAGRLGEDGLSERPSSERMPRAGLALSGRKADTAIRALALLLEEWVPALHGRPAPRVPTLRDGWVVQQVIDAARRSSDGAGWVALKTD